MSIQLHYPVFRRSLFATFRFSLETTQLRTALNESGNNTVVSE
ncbi:MAG: hypothetical protein V7L14_05805 [Nostoc sp.]